MNWEAAGAIGEMVGAAAVVLTLFYLAQVDYDAWLAYTASLLRTPGGSIMWRNHKTVITPTPADIIDQELERNPDGPSFNELIPIFRRDTGPSSA